MTRKLAVHLDAFKKAVEAVGRKVNGFYFTMGKYDGVVIIECPKGEAVAALIVSAGSRGNVRTQTMKAFTEDQFRNIIAKGK